ncbi:hypothetical protein OG871_04490 [Kitasatospora sp. NBC_00374]|uniref:alpha/beta fold hydrolase n=1 Tax=Kitasatospora sp. NBC_00374 TaxID=2975964 RepID=UPI00324F339E
MAGSGAAELRAAVEGRSSLEALLTAAEFDPESFTAADRAALGGAWSWLADVAGRGLDNGIGIGIGIGAMVDDDLAYVRAWGFDPAQVAAPTLALHGGRDRIVPSAHGVWLARRCHAAELRLLPGEGHVSVLAGATAALDWLSAHHV